MFAAGQVVTRSVQQINGQISELVSPQGGAHPEE